MKILFICTGNTSRSPMAEAMFRKMIIGTALEGNTVCLSAGLATINGMAIASNAQISLMEINIDIREHKSRRFNSKEIPIWDIYFAMSETHAYILEKAGIPLDKIYIPKQPIVDPYDSDLDTYRLCRNQLEKELELFIGKLCKYEDRENDE